ncbi:FmdB family transcriptional regulator [Collinsella sp. BA40]|uniref:FmdB family zinc ribbon protein n=1 Tax=Collinsella sp. BA40 TaxID=2560852 RepID=UPI0011C75065|nr:FmdB family zinc ribbon protein [Collinsella sp. BA40]TXF36595.1 FmdB family transcriptional regulator [Collinsella sp. BA40]
MARYDYRCTSCGTVFEVEHGMTEHPAITCPCCGNPADKVFSASGIKFEGSGFYNTDMRSGGSSTAATSAPASEGGCSCADCPHQDA